MLAIWLTVLAPLTLLPGLTNRWLWPPLVVTVIAALLATLLPPRGRMPRALVISLGVAGVVFLVAALQGEAPLAQVFGRAPRYEGLPTLLIVCLGVWLGTRLLGPSALARELTTFRSAISTASILVGALAVLETLGVRPIESDLDRPGSFAGNSTDQAIWAAIYLALTGAMILTSVRRAERVSPLVIAGSIAALAALVTSASRAGVAVGGILLLVLAILIVRASANRMRAGLIAVGGFAITLGAMWLIPGVRERFDGSDALAVQSFSGRGDIWQAALDIWQSAPWLGVGPSGFQDAVVAVLPESWYANGSVEFVLNSPHNVVLQVLVAGGIVGLLAALAVAATVIWYAIRTIRTVSDDRRDLVWGAALATMAAGLILMTHLTSPKTILLIAPLVGILVAQPAAAKAGALVRAASATALGVLLVATLLWTTADGAMREGQLAALTGDVVRAQSSFDTAAALRPWDADLALNAARALAANTANPAALALAQGWSTRAATALPHSSVALEAAGSTALATKDLPSATHYFADAAALAPVNPRIQHQYGLALLLAGDYAGARDAFERALRLAPDNEVTRAALTEACRLGKLTC